MARKSERRRKSGVNVATVVIVAGFVAVAMVLAMVKLRRQPIVPLVLSKEEYPVTGLDLSAHNGDVDFARLAADSIDFVVLKATEGATFKDPRFEANYQAARRAGIAALGAYHFFRFDADGRRQGENMLATLAGKTLELPLVIDLEEWTNPRRLPTDTVVARLQAMIDCIESQGHPVMLYTNKDGYERFVRGRFCDYPLWICSFTEPPMPADADMEWTLWQYSHWGWTAATVGEVDLNAFNGTRSQWLRWLHPAPLAASAAPTAPAGQQPSLTAR